MMWKHDKTIIDHLHLFQMEYETIEFSSRRSRGIHGEITSYLQLQNITVIYTVQSKKKLSIKYRR